MRRARDNRSAPEKCAYSISHRDFSGPTRVHGSPERDPDDERRRQVLTERATLKAKLDRSDQSPRVDALLGTRTLR